MDNNLSTFINNFIETNTNLFDKLMNKTFNNDDINNNNLFYFGVLCILVGMIGLILN